MCGGGMRWFRSLLKPRADHTIPTVDYYFLGAMNDLVRAGNGNSDARPIIRLGPHTFAHGRRLVIIRYLTADELATVRNRTWERVYYVIDDMLPVAGDCEELPVGYRTRLACFAAETLPAILALEPTIVAPRHEILELFPGHAGERLDPMTLFLARGSGHFDKPISSTNPFRIAFLGTRSHAEGLAFLVPVLDAVVGARRDIRVVLFFGRHLPQLLKGRPRIESRRPLPWSRYKAVLEQERFHAVLAPLPDTLFNQGRSITKFFDVAAVGAAGLFSARPPFTDAVLDGVHGLLLPDDPAAWRDSVQSLASNLAAARRLSEAAQARARQLGDPARVRAFWRARLGL
jgi:hypothetical protein